jgi:hypothetical protein
MEPRKLQQLLEELHQELRMAKSVDPASRKLLEQLLDDISQVTGEGAAGSQSPTGQLREAALRLEAEHPRLAAALGQLGDALAKLGI